MINRTYVRKTVYLSMLLAFSLILSYVESLLPLTAGIPGMKLGLPNLAVLLTLWRFGPGEALTVNLSRVVLSGFLFGNFAAILYSLAGAIFSFAVMVLLKRCKVFSITGVSIAGGIAHNIGQILMAIVVVSTFQISYYLPFLLLAGCVTGLCLGIAADRVLRHLPHPADTYEDIQNRRGDS